MSETKTAPDDKAVKKKAPAPPSATPAAAPAPAEPPPFDPPPGQWLYEAMWLVDPGAARENFTKVVAGIKELVEKSGGAWVNGDKWEERKLAYPIKKRKRGMFVLSHFSAPPDQMPRLERNIQISDLVLRALITVDIDGLRTSPPVREIDDDDFMPGGPDRRFFGGGGGGGRDRDRDDRQERREK